MLPTSTRQSRWLWALLLVPGCCVIADAIPAQAQFANPQTVRVSGPYRRKLPDHSSGDTFNLRLTRGAASSASSGGLGIGGCITGCALSQAELAPIAKTVTIEGRSGEGTATTDLKIRYSGFGIQSLVDGATPAQGSPVSLGATTLEVSSIATSNLAVLKSLPNVDPQALAAVEAAVAAAETGEPASTGTGRFVCQLAICTPEEIRQASQQGAVPIPRYNEAYTAFTLVQEVESTDLDFIRDFAASAF